MKLQLLHLPEFQLDRGRPAENAHRNLHPRAGIVDFFHRAVKGRERSIRNADLFSDLERDRRFRPFDSLLHLLQDARRLGVRDRHRLVITAEKSRHLWRILDQMVSLVRKVHLHQDVARKKLALRVDLAPAPDLDDLFLRNDDLIEQMVQVALLGLLANGFGDLVLEVRVGLHDVPALAHVRNIRSFSHPPIPSTSVTTLRMIISATRKNTEATATMTNTMAVVMAVSRRDGQVTFEASARTSCMNLNGLNLAITESEQTLFAAQSDRMGTITGGPFLG